MTNIAYIPVRGGSRSIPSKNIRTIADKPLVYWSTKAACDCESIDEVYVSSDSDAIRSVVEGFGFCKAKAVGRSVESASDTAPTELGMLEFAKSHIFSNIVLIQATSPLVTASDLRKGLELRCHCDADSVLSVVRQKRFIWNDISGGYVAPANYDHINRPRRQEFNGYLVENGAFYITGRESLLNSKCRISGRIKTVEMAAESYLELDEEEDWPIVEGLLRRRRAAVAFPVIKMFIADCDGTLTDSGMYYSSNGEEMKKFNTRDGVGFRLMKERRVITGIVTGETSKIVQARAAKLDVDEFLMGVRDKSAAIAELCRKHRISMQDVAYIGDDINDVEVLQNVGFGICVADGTDTAKAAAAYVTRSCGGAGAVREAVDLIIDRAPLSH